MPAQVRKLGIALVLLGVMFQRTQNTRAQATYLENYCYCEAIGYLYSTDEYGPWLFIDQSYDVARTNFYIQPSFGFTLWPLCQGACDEFSKAEARRVCNLYELPDEHYQRWYSYRFIDGNNDSGGTRSDSYGPAPLTVTMCTTL